VPRAEAKIELAQRRIDVYGKTNMAAETLAAAPTVLSQESALRQDGRRAEQLRPLRFQNHIAPHAAGSTLIEWGNTRVICGVTVEANVPRWMKEQDISGGWITAEYSMLPYSTLERKAREISRGKTEGRTQEIQRLIGRSLRTALDLEKLGPRTIWVDCDVLQADGGTRTAAITGGFVALSLAVKKLLVAGVLQENPLVNAVAAISVAIVNHQVLVDLCYTEDAAAEVDMNLVMTSHGEFVELQGSGEESTFTETQLTDMLAAGRTAMPQLFQAQYAAINAT
jgi:ribonuclease PH